MRVMMGLGQLIKTFTFIKLELCLGHLQAADAVGHYPFCSLQEFLRRRFAAALLPRLFGNNIHDSRSHHKGATGFSKLTLPNLPFEIQSIQWNSMNCTQFSILRNSNFKYPFACFRYQTATAPFKMA